MERIEIVTQLVAAALARGHVVLSEDAVAQCGEIADWIIVEDIQRANSNNYRVKET